MIEKIAYRVSASVLLIAALAIIVMLATGLTRVANSGPAPISEMEHPVAVQKIDSGPIEVDPAVLGTIGGDPLETAEAAPADIVSKLPLSDKFVVKRILKIDQPFVHGVWVWDDEGVPDGELVVTVDLKAESISVFRDGYEIGAAVITFGDSLKPTPTGVFPITQKSKDHVSNIYGSPMPYMLRLTNDGIAIHATDVKWGWGTRGCIGVPEEFARLLFERAKLGDRVVITSGKRLHLGDAIAPTKG